MVRPSNRAGVPVFNRPTVKPRVPQGIGKSDRWLVPCPPPRVTGKTDMDQPPHESPGGEDYGFPCKADTGLRIDSEHQAPRYMQGGYLSLLQVEFFLIFQYMLHPQPVLLLIGLGSGGAHGRSLAGIENAELDAGSIDVLCHLPPKASISFTRCPLANPPIAGLHDMRAMASRLRVRRRVLHPMRAAANAASQPACPAPTTITSYFLS